MVSPEVQSHGSSIQWRGNFHWTLCVSTLIQSGVDIASDGLAPLLNQGSQFSVFSRKNISANHLDAAFAPLERHAMPAEVIVGLERSTASIQWSDDHWALVTPLNLLFFLRGRFRSALSDWW